MFWGCRVCWNIKLFGCSAVPFPRVSFGAPSVPPGGCFRSGLGPKLPSDPVIRAGAASLHQNYGSGERTSSDFSEGVSGIPADRARHLAGEISIIFAQPVDLSAYVHAALVARAVHGSGDLLRVARAVRAGCSGGLSPRRRRRLLPRPGIAMLRAGKSECGVFTGLLAFHLAL